MPTYSVTTPTPSILHAIFVQDGTWAGPPKYKKEGSAADVWLFAFGSGWAFGPEPSADVDTFYAISNSSGPSPDSTGSSSMTYTGLDGYPAPTVTEYTGMEPCPVSCPTPTLVSQFSNSFTIHVPSRPPGYKLGTPTLVVSPNPFGGGGDFEENQGTGNTNRAFSSVPYGNYTARVRYQTLTCTTVFSGNLAIDLSDPDPPPDPENPSGTFAPEPLLILSASATEPPATADTTPGFSWTFQPPGGTQTAWQLRIYSPLSGRFVYDSGKVSGSASTHTLPTALAVGDYTAYCRTWNGSDLVSPDATRAFRILAGAPPTLPPPDAPGELRILRLDQTTIDVRMPQLPTNAERMQLQVLVGAGWEAVAGAEAITIGYFVVTASDLTLSTDYTFRAAAFNAEDVMAAGPPLDARTRATPAVEEVPAAPAPPTLGARTPTSATIKQSAWQEGQTSMKLRRARGGGAPVLVHTFASNAEAGWLDAGAQHGDVYTLVAVNAVGDSAPSAGYTLSLLSGATLTWITPAAAAVLSEIVTLSFSSDVALTNPRVSFGGPLLAATLVSGVYSVQVDTRDYVSGARILTALGEDPLGFPASATRAVTLANTLREGTRYTAVPWNQPALGGGEYTSAAIALLQHPLSPNLSRRCWITSALSPQVLGDLANPSISREIKAEQFDSLQRVVLGKGQPHDLATDALFGGREWAKFEPLSAAKTSLGAALPWNRITWAMQATPAQRWSHYATDCEQVTKMRPIGAHGDGTYFVFASSPLDGDGARVFTFDGALNLKRDLGSSNAGDATDAALLDDKLWVIRTLGDGSEIFVIDLDAGQSTLNLTPREEDRTPRFVEVLGTTVVAIFVDGALPSARSRGYDMTFSAPKLLWTLDEAISGVWSDGVGMVLWSGAKYFRIVDGVPVLQRTFASNVLGAWFDTDSKVAELAGGIVERAFLANGSIWEREGASTWSQAVAPNARQVLAGTAWAGGRDLLYGVAGGEGAQLVEELESGTWMDARTVPGVDAEDLEVASITAMQRYFKIIEAAQDTGGLPGAGTPAIIDERLLVGTGAQGLLAVLELTDLSATGAILASKISHLSLDPFSGE